MRLRQHIEAQDLLYYSMLWAKEVECIDVTYRDDPLTVSYEELYEALDAEIVGFQTVDADTRKAPTVNSRRLLVIQFERCMAWKEKPRPHYVKQIHLITKSNVMGKSISTWDEWFQNISPCSNPRLVRLIRHYADEDGRLPAYIIRYSNGLNDSFEPAPYPEFCHDEIFLRQSWSDIISNVYYKDRDELLPVLAAERDKLLQDEGINVNDVTLYDVLGVRKATAKSFNTVLVDPDPALEPDDPEDCKLADALDELGLSSKPQPYWDFERRPIDLSTIKIGDSVSLICDANNAGLMYRDNPTVTWLNQKDLAELKRAFLDGEPGFWTVGIHEKKLNISKIELPPEFEFERNDIEVI